ncbi:hypothetical protein FIC_01197 [Flavobacteriaceae bacterium 3519-10]|nr:hypothetical protein FIC_01197 [Flavobacteriaceae bacterium 3519-10]
MKFRILVTAATLLCCSVHAQMREMNYLKESGTKGNVKSVKVIRQEVIDNSGKLTGYRDPTEMILEFDTSGNAVSAVMINGDVTEARQVRKYNSRNLKYEQENYHYGTDCGAVTKYEYDKKDNLTTVTYYNCDGTLRLTERMEYDLNNNLIFKSTNFGKTSDTSLKFKYDGRNNLIEQVLMNRTNGVEQKTTTTYTYDSSNVRKTKSTLDNNGSMTYHVRYEDADHYTAETYDDGKKSYERVYKTEKKNIDSVGNWTEEIYYRDGKAYERVTRYFTYY